MIGGPWLRESGGGLTGSGKCCSIGLRAYLAFSSGFYV